MEELGKSNEVRNEQGQRDTDSLIEWLREKETFLLEHGAKAQHAHVAAGEPQPATQWAEPPPGAWKPPPAEWQQPDEAPQDGALYATEEGER